MHLPSRGTFESLKANIHFKQVAVLVHLQSLLQRFGFLVDNQFVVELTILAVAVVKVTALPIELHLLGIQKCTIVKLIILY